MSSRSSRFRSSTDRAAPWWPVLLSLLVVLIPTVCVLWFMTEAVENRRLVIRRTLADADYTLARERLENHWNRLTSQLKEANQRGDPPPLIFQRWVLDGLADSVVVSDHNGQPAYPTLARSSANSFPKTEADWNAAEQLEYRRNNPVAAADAYAGIAAHHGDPAKNNTYHPAIAAQALIAQARCLAKTGQRNAAATVLSVIFTRTDYSRTVDEQGRLLAAAAELRTLELIKDVQNPEFREISAQLIHRLNLYDDPLLSAPQRRFLMKRVLDFLPDTDFPTLTAEETALKYMESNPASARDGAIHPTSLPGIWKLASADGRVVALFRTENVLLQSGKAMSGRELMSGATVSLVPPGGRPPEKDGLASAEAGPCFPGWRLTRSVRIQQRQEPVTDTQIVAYFWTGVLVIAAMAIFALFIARTFYRQMKLTRLRNDLVATVSHELKTPLASIRLLVDTLRNESQMDEQQVREYLDLMARENKRLSRLIDNFLAFSRMERGRHTFEFANVEVNDVVAAAVETIGDRFTAPNCQFEVQMAAELPPLLADSDAIVTVLLNLLENAFRYSTEDKHIMLRAFAREDNVCLEVEDNGIGLSAADSRKVFRRFFQVDQRVSRETDGVGLGLSIVQFIVSAHNGTVSISSHPGRGSTFTVTLPGIRTTAETADSSPRMNHDSPRHTDH